MSEQYILEVGDSFTASSLSPLSGNWRVAERYEQAGFCYYRALPLGKKTKSEDSTSVFRNKDVDESTIKKAIKKFCRFSYNMGRGGFRCKSVHSYFDFESLESVFARLKEEQSRRYPSSRSFMIESDQDSEEIRQAWKNEQAI